MSIQTFRIFVTLEVNADSQEHANRIVHFAMKGIETCDVEEAGVFDWSLPPSSDFAHSPVQVREWIKANQIKDLRGGAHGVLYTLAARLSQQEWNAGTCDDIAKLLRDAGIPIADVGEGEAV